MPAFKQAFWKLWYQYISGRIGSDSVTFLNYGYYPPEGETIKLHPEDESNRPAIQLYHHVASGAELASDPGLVRDIDRAMGWVDATDVDGDGEIEQAEVEVLPRSLLAKALVAQKVFDEKFLLPPAPLPPTFYLVPGPNQVTIVWQPSPTERIGDPYYAIASQQFLPGGSLNPLYDANYRGRPGVGPGICLSRTRPKRWPYLKPTTENPSF